jgi:hypothetical protein
VQQRVQFVVAGRPGARLRQEGRLA